MDHPLASTITNRLLKMLDELEAQKDVSNHYLPDLLPYSEEMAQIREFITAGSEYGLAYEYLAGTLGVHPFILSGKAAIALLEVALIFGFKTESPEDKEFDRRTTK